MVRKMTKPTKNEILNCNDEKQLREWVATICYKWHKVIEPAIADMFAEREFWTSDDRETGEYVDCFNPCLPTVEGESQCFRLMVKYDLYPAQAGSYLFLLGYLEIAPFNKEYLQTAIVKAAIISEMEQ